MKVKRIIMLVGICVALLACSINLAQAGTAITVYAVDGYHSNGVNDGLFVTNENVYISWSASGSNPLVDVYVISISSGQKVELFKSNTALGSGGVDSGTELYNQPLSSVKCIYFVPEENGYYQIYCIGLEIQPSSFKVIGVGTVLVTPESGLGSVMALATGLAAIGAIGIVKQRYSKVKKA